MGKDGLTEEHDALEVDGEDAVPLLLGHAVDGAAGGDGGAVHQNVEAAEALDGAGHGTLDGGLVGDVCLQADGVAPGCGDFLGGALHAVGVEVGEGDGGALAGQGERGGASDAGRGTGDQRDFPVNAPCHEGRITRGGFGPAPKKRKPPLGRGLVCLALSVG